MEGLETCLGLGGISGEGRGERLQDAARRGRDFGPWAMVGEGEQPLYRADEIPQDKSQVASAIRTSTLGWPWMPLDGTPGRSINGHDRDMSGLGSVGT